MSNNSTIDLVEELEARFGVEIFGAYDNNNCTVDDESDYPKSGNSISSPEEIVMDPRGPRVAEVADEAEITLRRNNFLLRQKWRIVKNLAFLNFALILDLCAVLNIIEFKFKQTPEFALIRLFVFYGSAAIGCLVVVQPITALLTHKWVVTICFIGHSLVIAARFYPTEETILAASALSGLALATSLSAAFAYVSRAAQVYTALTSQSLDTVIGKFMGCSWMACLSANVWGPMISGFILQTLDEPMFPSGVISHCGSTVCFNKSIIDFSNNFHLNDTTIELNSVKENTLLGTFLGLVILACITTAVCVGRLPPAAVLSDVGQNNKASEFKCRYCCFSIVRTVQLWSDCCMIFLVPFLVHLGLQVSFFRAAFMQHFAACSIGTWSMCFLVITFGGLSSIASLVCGGLSHCVQRRTLMTIAALVQFGIFAWLFIWQLHDFHFYIFVAILSLWALTDSIWVVSISRFLGAAFSSGSEESSFANMFLWVTLGSFIGDYLNSSLCIYNQLYILMGTLCLGIGGYYGAEVLMYRKKINEMDICT